MRSTSRRRAALAAQTTEVEELGAANLVGAELLDLVHHLRVQREDTLHALTEAHLADGEGSLRAMLLGNHNALKGLQTLLLPFLDLYLHAYRVAGDKIGKIRTLELLGQLLHDGMDRHDGFLT